MWWPPFCSNATADIVLDHCNFFRGGLILYKRNADSISGGKSKKKPLGRDAVFLFCSGLGFLGAGGHSRTLGILYSSEVGVLQPSWSSPSFSTVLTSTIFCRKSSFCCCRGHNNSVLEGAWVVRIGFKRGKTMPSISKELSAFLLLLSLDRSTVRELIPMTAIIIWASIALHWSQNMPESDSADKSELVGRNSINQTTSCYRRARFVSSRSEIIKAQK